MADSQVDRVDADPRLEYLRRLGERREAAARLARRDEAVANLRLATFLAIPLVLGMAGLGWIGIPWATIPTVLFAGLVLISARLSDVSRRAARAVGFYERGLARLDGTWMGHGQDGARFLAEEHPYAADLDVFGRGSLYERLCTARTSPGEETIAAWLKAPAGPAEIRERQEAVRELSGRLDLLEELALIGEDVRAGIDPAALIAWGEQVEPADPYLARRVAAGFATLAAIGLVGWGVLGTGPTPFLIVALIEAAIAWRLRHRVRRALSAVDRREHDLELLAELLARVEQVEFRSTWLRRLQEGLTVDAVPASARIGRLRSLVRLLDWRRNQLFIPLALALNWTTQIALAIEAWRRRHGRSIGPWLETVGRLEAIGALSLYAFENPADLFPEIVEAGPCLRADALGHPLLPLDRVVRNDVALGDGLSVIAISGSNMSGKSTFLRTIGANVVLAQAGAPVRAARMTLSPLMPGGTLRVQDSLQSGKSRFYAEITRLRQLFDLSRGSPPLLFLLDEVLHGTNSHERLQGAEAIVRKLIDLGAIGLFTTHDLALAEAAERLAPRARNAHFEDQVSPHGELIFDYQLRPGVVPRSNAIALMRAVGLDV